ncbi:MAG TPA: GTP cyclohydrolase, FolE2/MptA family, partial [bacterium]|nr:GTP cyclohydrolase, FolE2/MptA family [bacterium]
VEKITPVSREKCLVQYLCTYSVKVSSVDEKPRVLFGMEIPVITTYPGSSPESPGGLFGQLSIVEIQVESSQDIYPEDLVEITDRHALAPVYSFLTPEDQLAIIQKVHTEVKSSVTMTDEIKEELARQRAIDWYAVRCSNFGMLHSYSTVISTEKSMWVPFSGHSEEL